MLELLERMGAQVTATDDAVGASRLGPLRPAGFTTGPHPDLPTDMQPQLSVLLCLADGASTVSEHVFPDRFGHVPELQTMGARITQDGPQAAIEGVERLTGAAVCAPDIRAGAALVVAGLAAEGMTVISGLDQIDRGYQDFEDGLRALGAQVYRRHRMPVSPDRKLTA